MTKNDLFEILKDGDKETESSFTKNFYIRINSKGEFFVEVHLEDHSFGVLFGSSKLNQKICKKVYLKEQMPVFGVKTEEEFRKFIKNKGFSCAYNRTSLEIKYALGILTKKQFIKEINK